MDINEIEFLTTKAVDACKEAGKHVHDDVTGDGDWLKDQKAFELVRKKVRAATTENERDALRELLKV